MRKRTSTPSVKKWITPEIIQSKQNLSNLHWLHKNFGLLDTYENYKIAKRQHIALIKRTKCKFYSSVIDNSSNRNKTVWNIVNGLTGRTNSGCCNISINSDGKLCSDPNLLADIFAKHFSTITTSKLKFCYGDDLSQSCTVTPMVSANFFFYPVTGSEVVETIKSLKNKKSVGVDSISTKIIKAMGEVVSEHFAHLINLSITSATFPRILKKSIVIPIFKSGNLNEIVNYRPISILSLLSKVFEKIVFSRMMNYLSGFKILNPAQHGFRSGHSTQSAAVDFFESVYECLDRNLFVAGVFFDLASAFDSLSFEFILEKCYNLGFRGVFLEWLRSYLNERSMSVRIGESYSESHFIGLGVPQGSVLGPLLFILFINDLPVWLASFLLTLFADDASVVVSAGSLGQLHRACECIVAEFLNWCRRNNLMVNINKTVCVRFCLRNSEVEAFSIRYGDNLITASESTKFLGIHVDKNLRWTTHIDVLCKKLNSSYFAIHRIKDILPRSCLMSVYFSLVYSHLSYNILLWGRSSDFPRVFVAQKRIIRTIFNLNPMDSCKSIFVENKILTLPCIYIFKCLLYAKENEFKWMKLSDYHGYETRNSQTLLFPRHKTYRFECSPMYQSIRMFNHLSPTMKSLNSKMFKKEIKNLLLVKGYYSVQEYLCDFLIP